MTTDASGLLHRVQAAPGERTEWRFGLGELGGVPIGAWPLRLLDNTALGRMVIADRDIAAGELVFSDEPFCQTMHDRCDKTNCHHCYAMLPASGHGISCPECHGQVTYCSEQCARGGFEMHEAECGVLGALVDSGNAALLKGLRGLRLFIRLVHKASASERF